MLGRIYPAAVPLGVWLLIRTQLDVAVHVVTGGLNAPWFMLRYMHNRVCLNVRHMRRTRPGSEAHTDPPPHGDTNLHVETTGALYYVRGTFGGRGGALARDSFSARGGAKYEGAGVGSSTFKAGATGWLGVLVMGGWADSVGCASSWA